MTNLVVNHNTSEIEISGYSYRRAVAAVSHFLVEQKGGEDMDPSNIAIATFLALCLVLREVVLPRMTRRIRSKCYLDSLQDVLYMLLFRKAWKTKMAAQEDAA